ncbi:MAG TPA: decaprenyl-phosphate phosphoribosyltransferase [Pseudothermotoga sp.]|nr:decaprenyl-phosphate phosphoribosyltransferase [Pseudothermotoga sp.]HOK82914.1 decaprenyl-phosphate phosphoribosyltransferase [Pseudothermotoga sp.]HPP69912.1 decaprenyl-phosphate phosphoribosyltransferase [Pseudothermotoga sp.]
MSFLKLIRPKHWVKNLFVVVPIVFAGKLLSTTFVLSSIIAFISFCLLSSGIYILNDIKDAPFDRLHPKKKTRPIAAGSVKVSMAFFVAFVLLISAFFLASLLNWKVVLCLVLYVLLNFFYTFKGKNVILIDVFCISAGFALRVIAGSYAISVAPSGWLVTSTFFLALFLGFGKRRGEIVTSQEDGVNHRLSLRFYDVNLLNNVMVSTGTAAVVFYALYTLDSRTIEQFKTDKLYYSIPFVVYGVFRYIFLLLKNGDGEPTDVVMKDRGMVLAVFLWFITVVLIIYAGG